LGKKEFRKESKGSQIWGKWGEQEEKNIFLNKTGWRQKGLSQKVKETRDGTPRER